MLNSSAPGRAAVLPITPPPLRTRGCPGPAKRPQAGGRRGDDMPMSTGEAQRRRLGVAAGVSSAHVDCPGFHAPSRFLQPQLWGLAADVSCAQSSEGRGGVECASANRVDPWPGALRSTTPCHSFLRAFQAAFPRVYRIPAPRTTRWLNDQCQCRCLAWRP